MGKRAWVIRTLAPEGRRQDSMERGVRRAGRSVLLSEIGLGRLGRLFKGASVVDALLNFRIKPPYPIVRWEVNREHIKWVSP